MDEWVVWEGGCYAADAEDAESGRSLGHAAVCVMCVFAHAMVMSALPLGEDGGPVAVTCTDSHNSSHTTANVT